ncbi:hypothetical protein GCM10023340_37840 [Nocardioides marinquilinus]|uniref:Uncharacterized protein n=2 Tax=Nocardioides marinquilinus TaxID=1210400 RepID=A0ABP9PYX7_9ACTN
MDDGRTGGTGDRTDGSDGAATSGAAEADRTRAGDVVRDLLAGLQADGGRPTSATGSFRGCRERFPEGVAAVEYVASARVDGVDDLAAVAPRLAGLGLGEPSATDVPGGRRLAVSDGGLTVTATHRPAAGAFVLLGVVGGCHDVAADDQDSWLARAPDDLTP